MVKKNIVVPLYGAKVRFFAKIGRRFYHYNYNTNLILYALACKT